MKLNPSTIAANLSAAAAAEAEAAANSNSTSTSNATSQANAPVSTTSTTTQPVIGPMSTTTMSTTATTNSLPGKSNPKDTQVIAAILQDIGIIDYDARVLSQLVEFAYRYTSRVLEDAQLFSAYAKKKVIDTHDIQIAAQLQMDRSFVGPPPRGTLLEIARSKNAQPLPAIKSHNGMRLPADRYSLVAANLRLASSKQQQSQQQQNNKSSARSQTGLSLLSKFSSTNISNSTTIKGSNQSSNNSFLAINPSSDVLGIKRRLDET